VISLPCKNFRNKFYRFLIDGDRKLKTAFYHHLSKCKKCNSDYRKNHNVEKILDNLSQKYKDTLNALNPFPNEQFNINLLAALKKTKQILFISKEKIEYTHTSSESFYQDKKSSAVEEHPFAETVPGVIPVCNPNEYEHSWFIKSSRFFSERVFKKNPQLLKKNTIEFYNKLISKSRTYLVTSLEKMRISLKEKTHPLISNTHIAKASVAFSCMFIIIGIIFLNDMFTSKNTMGTVSKKHLSPTPRPSDYFVKDKDTAPEAIVSKKKEVFTPSGKKQPVEYPVKSDDSFFTEHKNIFQDPTEPVSTASKEGGIKEESGFKEYSAFKDYNTFKEANGFKALSVDYMQDDSNEFASNDLFMMFFHPVTDTNQANASKDSKSEKEHFLKTKLMKSKKAPSKPVSIEMK
jgi:hypothetical protein